jgi:hypothetical protein
MLTSTSREIASQALLRDVFIKLTPFAADGRIVTHWRTPDESGRKGSFEAKTFMTQAKKKVRCFESGKGFDFDTLLN